MPPLYPISVLTKALIIIKLQIITSAIFYVYPEFIGNVTLKQIFDIVPAGVSLKE